MSRREREQPQTAREREGTMVACLIHTRGAPQIGFRPDRTSLMAHEISPKISANLRLAKVANVATFDEHTAGWRWRWWRCGKLICLKRNSLSFGFLLFQIRAAAAAAQRQKAKKVTL